MRSVWCVRWIDRETKKDGWCATYYQKPSEDAWRDKTLCNNFVIMRLGEAKRIPTCPECKNILLSKIQSI